MRDGWGLGSRCSFVFEEIQHDLLSCGEAGVSEAGHCLAELDRTKDMVVSTFRGDDERGLASRAIYRKFGFAEGNLTVEFGYPVQEFILPHL